MLSDLMAGLVMVQRVVITVYLTCWFSNVSCFLQVHSETVRTTEDCFLSWTVRPACDLWTEGSVVAAADWLVGQFSAQNRPGELGVN